MKILVFGSLNIDRRYTVDHFVQPGETLSSLEVSEFCGGKGLNQAIACKKAGSSVYMAGKTGADGAFLVKELERNGVEVKHIFTETAELSGHAIIQVDKKGQNCILLYGGTNRTVTKQQVDSVLCSFEAGDIILLQNEINLLDYIIEKAAQKGMQVVLNPSPMDEKLLQCDLSKVSCFIMNEIEAAAVSGLSDPKQAMECLVKKYPESKIVITLGGDGSMYFDGNEIYRHGIYSVKAVDTTAAGDTFTGYFLNGIIEAAQPMEILARASKAAAIAVSRHGAADSIPLREEVAAAQLEIKEN